MGGAYGGKLSVKMGTDIFAGLAGGCFQLLEAFAPMILQLPTAVKQIVGSFGRGGNRGSEKFVCLPR